MQIKNKAGFTLIELLVVVLITGLLAAAAVPQYQKAVLKSRFAQLQITTRVIYDALQRYRMASGTYPKDLTDLDIVIGGALKNGNTTVYFGPYHCEYYFQTSGAADSILCQLEKPAAMGMRYFLTDPDRTARYCLADASSKAAQEVCKSLGGINPVDNGIGLLHYTLP